MLNSFSASNSLDFLILSKPKRTLKHLPEQAGSSPPRGGRQGNKFSTFPNHNIFTAAMVHY